MKRFAIFYGHLPQGRDWATFQGSADTVPEARSIAKLVPWDEGRQSTWWWEILDTEDGTTASGGDYDDLQYPDD